MEPKEGIEERKLWDRILRPACFANKEKLLSTCLDILLGKRDSESGQRAIDEHCLYFSECVNFALKKMEEKKAESP